MIDYLIEFRDAADFNTKWQICERYHETLWALAIDRMTPSCQIGSTIYYITDVYIPEYGKVQVGSLDILPSLSIIRVEPPRTIQEYQSCMCPLFCYEE